MNKRVSVWNKTSEAVSNALLQIGKPRGTRRYPKSTKRDRNRAKEEKQIQKRDNCLNEKLRCCCTDV